MNKKIFLLLLFVLALVSMSAISAADVNDDNQTLTLDSSSDISEVSDNVLAMSNDNEIQQIPYSDDLLGDAVQTMMHPSMPEICREGEFVDAMFYISPYDYDDDLDVEVGYEWGIMQYDGNTKTSLMVYDDDRTDIFETDIFSAFFYNIEPLSPGYHYFSFIYLGSEDNQPCSENFYKAYELKEGSKIVFTDFSPGLTDGKIIMDYGDSTYVSFRAVSEKTGNGLRNVPFYFQLDDYPQERISTGTGGELAVILEGRSAGNHVLKITTADDKFPVEYNLPITVLHAPVYLDVDPEYLNLAVGDKGSIDAELIPPEAGGANFASSNTNVVTVDNAGNYEAIGVGEANITVSYPGDYIYAAAEVVVPVTVSKIETNIVVEDYEPLELDVEETGRIVAILNPLEAGSVIFNSSNKSVVTVDNKGNYKAIREGEANITLSYMGNNRYMAAEDVVVPVSVSKIETSIIVDPEYLDLDLEVDDEDYIGASIDPSEAGSVIFTSSNESVVTVDNKGHYKAVGEGKANITFSYAGNYKYTAAEDITMPVIVSKIENNINVDSEYLDLDLEVDDEDRIVAWLDYPDGGRITFTSSNESVVTVDNNGNYKAVGEGEANITLSYAGNYKYTAAEDIIIPVIVSKIETTIFVYEDSLELYVGDSDIILKEFNPPEAGNITFTSSNESVVTVDDNGNVKAVSKGEANITVSFAGDYKYTSCEAIVAVKVSMIETAINLISKDYLELHVGDEDSINAVLIPPKAGVITFTSSDESVVIVDNVGNLVAVGEGKANITLSFRGNSRCAAAENVTVTVNVSKIDTKIKTYFNHMELFVGDEDIIVAELRPNEAGNITFTSSDETVVTVDNVGNLVAVGEGEANITISFAGNNKYKAVEATVNVNVSKKSVRIELMSNDTLELNVYDVETIIAFIVLDDGSEMIPQDLLDSLEYNAYSDDDDDDDDDDDSAEDIVEVDDQGNVMAVGEGEATIVISFGGNDKYEAADDITVSVIVSMVETSINLTSKDSLELFVGDEDSINAELNPNDAGNITFTSSDESVVTVDDYGNLVAVGEGEAEITLSFDGDERYVAADDVIVTVTVSKIDTSITADKNSLEMYVGDEDSITAVLNPEEAGNITFTSSDETVVTVDSEGNLVAVGEGEANITISFSGDNKYAAAEDITVSVTVSMIETTINLTSEDSLELFVGDEDSIIAELDPEEAGNITFTSSDESVVTVDGEGNLVAVGEGEAEITLSFAGDERYTAAENVTVSVTVSKIETTITVDEDYLELNVGDEDTISAELDPEEAGNMTFTSSDESVVTVDGEGNLVAVGEGEANITISFSGDNKYADAEDVIITVTVSKIETAITVDEDYFELNVGDEDSISAELDPEEAGNMTFTSSDESVVAVDGEGNLVAVGEGEANITVSFSGDDKYAAAEDITISVTVSMIETAINLNSEDSLELFVDDEDSIIAELSPEEAGNITFTSSDETVVKVDSEGNLVAVGEGQAEITLSFAGDERYTAAENVTVSVTVSKIETAITVDEDYFELNVGDEDSIVAELDPEEAGNMTFTSSDESVVAVDGEGNLVAVGEGEANITVSFSGDDKYAAAEDVIITVTVSKIETAITVDEDYFELNVGDEDSIVAELDPEEAGNMTFTSSDESVVKVDSEGNLIAVGEGEANITVSFSGDDKYAAAEDVIITVTVSMIETAINLNSEDSLELFVDDEDSIIAELSPEEAGNIIFTSSDETVVAVDSEGNLVAVGEGQAEITLSFAGDERYAAADNVTVSVTVSKIETTIAVDEDYLELNVGDEDSIVAELDPEEAGNISFTSSDESVVAVDSEGNLVAVGEGEANITISFSGDNKYAAAEDVIITVTVSKIETTITVDEDYFELNVGDEDSIIAELDPEEAGNITFASSDESVVAVDSEGNLVAVGEGQAEITLSFTGDERYTAAENVTVSVTVSKIETTITVDEDYLEFNVGDEDTISAELDPEEAGNITFTSSDESVVAVDSEGNLVAVGEGEANITISFSGDNKYAAAEDVIITVTVSKIETDIIADDSLELYVGDEDSIDAELNPEEAGKITFTSSDESVVKVDSEGNLIAVGEGEANITLSFAGDDKYTGCEATVAVTVSKIETSIFVYKDSLEFLVDDEDIIIAEINPEEAGNITFKSSNGSVVTVDDDGNVKAVGNGKAVITLSFAGDDKYTDCEATVTVTVSKIDTIIRVDDDYLDLFVGDEKGIVAILVVDYDSGMIPISYLKSLNYTSSDESVVTVDDEGNVKAVGNGKAVITISFAGDYKYNAAEDETIPVTVSLKDASISAEPKSLDLHVGENSEIYYFITPEDLDVKFASTNESVATVKKGDGFVVVTAVGKGNAIITLTVGDDIVYAMNSTTISVTVSKIATEIVVDDLLTLNVGDKTIIDLTTTPDGLDVIYESNDTSVAVVNNYGIITAVSNGTALITIKIEENAIYKSSQATVTVIVYPKDKKEKEELNITVDADDIIAGEDAIIMIFGLENATGTIIITVDGKTYAVPIYGGEATLDIPDLDVGNYIIPIYYPGDDNYDPVNIYINLTVGEDKSDVISTNDVTKYYGDSKRYVVVVTDHEGNPVAGKNVSFLINGVPYTRTTNNDGFASIALNLASGLYNITVTVDNKTTTSQVNILPTVNGTDVVKVLKNGTQYYATFRDHEGNYLKAGTTVRFNINGIIYERKVFGDKGLAKLNINLPAGEYVITAMNLVTGENTANKIKVISRLIENKDITKYYKNGTQYTVKVINSDGTVVGAGVVVTFNINGVLYTRITNESGIARLNINLQPGNYIITAEYLDCKVSNNIKVLSVLSASDMSMRYHDGSKFTANLVDGQGKAYVGQTVKFNINGVLYNRVTDSLGQAKLNINLMAGKYIITSSYNGLNIAKTITIYA